ncbi:MAG: DUF368 domain-containing protein [Clostridia bacterium]|nr:DUF368 domain-containing protein [Clostridia bacterium]
MAELNDTVIDLAAEPSVEPAAEFTAEPAAEPKKKRSGLVEALILFVKGIVVGVANIIPGVSGGTIAVVTGIFDPLIEAINTLFKKFVKNLKFLIPVGLGLVAGVVAFSKLIGFALAKFPLQTGLFFVGLVIGSVPLILKKANSDSKYRNLYLIPFVICALAVVALAIVQTYFTQGTDQVVAGGLPTLSVGMILKLFIGGVVSAGAMVVPGVSGSLVLLLLGLYDDMLAIISGLTSFHEPGTMLKAALCALPLGLGIIAGIFTIAKIIQLLFKKFKSGTYYGILGLLAGSILALLISLNLPALSIGFAGIIIGLVTLAAGIAASYFSSKI